MGRIQSATMTAEGVSNAINQAPATFCLHVPMFDTREAAQRARNSDWRSGAQVDSGSDRSRLLIWGSDITDLSRQSRAARLALSGAWVRIKGGTIGFPLLASYPTIKCRL
jgi:hypothetical protein